MFTRDSKLNLLGILAVSKSFVPLSFLMLGCEAPPDFFQPKPLQKEKSRTPESLEVDVSVISVDTVQPDGEYGLGDFIHIVLSFPQKVIITSGGPALRIDLNGIGRKIPYYYGSGTDQIIFEYQIQNGDFADKLTLKDALVFTEGSKIKTTTGKTANIIMMQEGQQNSLSYNRDISINALDKEVPLPPTLLLPTHTNTQTFQASSSGCVDTSHILISDSPISPSPNDPNWQTCSTTPSSISIQIEDSADGVKQFYAWAKDVSNNISPPRPYSVSYDTTPPVLSSLSINNGVFFANGALLPILLSESGTPESTGFQLSFSSDFSSSSWLSEFPSFYNFGVTNQVMQLFVRTRDAAGNISNVVSSSVSIALDAPALIGLLEASVNGSNELVLQWEIDMRSSDTLRALPLEFFYTTDDGQTLTPLFGGQSYDTNVQIGGCSLASDALGCFRISNPTVGLYRVVARITDSVGNVSIAMSPVLNGTSGLVHVAGRFSSALSGSALSTALHLPSHIAYDRQRGFLYALVGCQIKKISLSKNLVTRFIGDSSNCIDSVDGELPENSTFRSGNHHDQTSMIVDSQGNLFWPGQKIIWKYNLQTNSVSRFIGNGLTGAEVDGVSKNSFRPDYQFGTLFIGKSDKIYFTTANRRLVDGENQVLHTLYTLEDNNTITWIAGSKSDNPTMVYNLAESALNNPSLSRSAFFRSYSIIPGDDASEDVILAASSQDVSSLPERYRAKLYRVNQTGTLSLLLEGQNVRGRLGQYLASSNLLPYTNYWGFSDIYFVNPFNQGLTRERYDYGGSLREARIVDDGAGGYFAVDRINRQIIHVDSNDNHTAVAGIAPDYGVGVDAKQAEIGSISSLSLNSTGDLFFHDKENLLQRKVNRTTGIIDTLSLQGGHAHELISGIGPMEVEQSRGGHYNFSYFDEFGNCIALCNASGSNLFPWITSTVDRSSLSRLAVVPVSPGVDDHFRVQAMGGNHENNSRINYFVQEFRERIDSNLETRSWTGRRSAIYRWEAGSLDLIRRVPSSGAYESDCTSISDGLSFNTHACMLPENTVIFDQSLVVYASGKIYGVDDITDSAATFVELTDPQDWHNKIAVSVSGSDYYLYYVDQEKLFRLQYTSDASAAPVEIADFSGELLGSSSSNRAWTLDPILSNTLWISSQRHIYRFTDSAILGSPL